MFPFLRERPCLLIIFPILAIAGFDLLRTNGRLPRRRCRSRKQVDGGTWHHGIMMNMMIFFYQYYHYDDHHDLSQWLQPFLCQENVFRMRLVPSMSLAATTMECPVPRWDDDHDIMISWYHDMPDKKVLKGFSVRDLLARDGLLQAKALLYLLGLDKIWWRACWSERMWCWHQGGWVRTRRGRYRCRARGCSHNQRLHSTQNFCVLGVFNLQKKGRNSESFVKRSNWSNVRLNMSISTLERLKNQKIQSSFLMCVSLYKYIGFNWRNMHFFYKSCFILNTHFCRKPTFVANITITRLLG